MLASASTNAAPAADPIGLTGLQRVRVHVDVADREVAARVAAVADHLVAALRRADPPIAVEAAAADALRVTVVVRPMSATELRGFWLPLSGTYAVGAVRLDVERMVTLPASPRPFPGVVWTTSRPVGVSWRAVGGEITRLLDAMVTELLEARRALRAARGG